MKICYCGPVSLRLLSEFFADGVSLPKGYEYPLGAYLVKTMRKAGIEVAVVTSCQDAKENQVFKGDRIEIHVTKRRSGLPLMLNAYATERRLLVKALKSTKADLVHAQWTYEFAHAALASDLPIVVTARDAPWAIAFQTRAPYRIFRAVYSSWLINKIKRLNFISPYLMERFTSMGYSNKMDLVPNGLPLELFLQEDLLKRRLNAVSDLKQDHPVCFLSVTGWDRRKNPKTLIRAFALLKKSHKQIKLNLVGKGMGTGGPAETWARKNGLSKGITFSGLVEHHEVLQLMRTGSDVFVHSTREESFCMTILEALAQGMPTVALPGSGAVPWLLDGGKAGKLAASGNCSDLAIAMGEMVVHPDQRKKYALAGYSRAKHHFTMEAIAKLYINLYQDTLCSKSLPV